MDELARRAIDVNEAQFALGNERFEEALGVFVRNVRVADIRDANHVSRVRAGTDAEIDALFGRCDEDLAVPYQPFVEAFSAYAAACDDDRLLAQLGPSGGELTRLVPLFDQRIGTAAVELGRVIQPEEVPANVAWGDDGKTLYMTARTGIYRIRLLVEGIRPYSWAGSGRSTAPRSSRRSRRRFIA